MTDKFTPGPWIVDFDIPATFEDGRTEMVFEIMAADRSTTSAYATSLDNARLIAAAPDLLAACQVVVEAWRKSPRTISTAAERACINAIEIAKVQP